MPHKRKSIFTDASVPGNPVAPKDAATVILLRPSDPGPFEVLLMKRHENQSFMGGAHVFPGGALEAQDDDPVLARRVSDLTPAKAAARLGEPDLDPAKVIGLYFAAVRETFEECGVLLGLGPTDDAVFRPGPEARLKLLSGELTLPDLAEAQDLRFDFSRMIPHARWITPESEPRRFDTRFMVARLPPGQVPTPDAREMTRMQWLTPEKALALQAKGEILLMPPTLKTVSELRLYASIDRILTAAAARTPKTICPKVFISGSEFGIKLPDDPQYEVSDATLTADQAVRSRVVMRNGRWQLMSAQAFFSGVDTDSTGPVAGDSA
ncbi:MAG: NUDIX hydrolase [Desulfobacterales bacterium]|nr:NUDIX hydrolase [Desulfobacterales bacterium]